MMSAIEESPVCASVIQTQMAKNPICINTVQYVHKIREPLNHLDMHDQLQPHALRKGSKFCSYTAERPCVHTLLY